LAGSFNPRRASSTRRTEKEVGSEPFNHVSIHAALHQRGELGTTPAMRSHIDVSIHAALHQRGEPIGSSSTATDAKVSIHAALHQRGEHLAARFTEVIMKFQSTPRFINAANTSVRSGMSGWTSFNPRRASSTRRTFIPQGNQSPYHGFNPRRASSTRRTRFP